MLVSVLEDQGAVGLLLSCHMVNLVNNFIGHGESCPAVMVEYMACGETEEEVAALHIAHRT